MTTFLLDVKLWQMHHVVASALFAQFAIVHAQQRPRLYLSTEFKIKFSVPGFVQNLNFCFANLATF